MDYRDPVFDTWLDEQETEADRVKRMADWRQRQASDLLLTINQARIVVSRVRSGSTKTDPSEIEGLVRKITEMRGKIGR
ncbi:MAG TPA: hypothetical protein VFK15_06995 [Burkholderiales bacterium]|jgi:hypothetical protein|nr:hypothetical protein [Burkholderiales bacterium]